ncbi:MAG: FAD-dependent monooxygenase [Gemmatimonadota bacterium]
MTVLIVGAGPTGLALALWLTRLGVAVRIIDKTAEPGTTSRALAVQARTLEFYQQLGFADQVVDAGLEIAGINLWSRGKQVTHVPLTGLGAGLSRFSFPLIYPQDAHEKLLIAQLASLGVHVERETTLLRFREHATGVSATIGHADGREEEMEAAYIAGCDGAHSTVREALGIGFPGGTYSGYFYVADVEAGNQAYPNQISVDIDDGTFLAIFPLTSSGHLRLIGTAPEQHGRALTFDDVKGRAVDSMQLDIAAVNWFSTYRVHHRVADHFRSGRAFLLGDAAHVHSPVGGQGMNTGIGDAVNLSWKLASVLNGKAASSLLASYEPERIAFARLLVATTDRAFTVVTDPSGWANFVRLRLFPLVAPWITRIPAVRRRLFRTVSQLIVSYRDSALSAGAAGEVHGGDRLPWVDLGGGRDNFAPLQSLGWQVHIYGHVPDALRAECGALGLNVHGFDWEPKMAEAGLKQAALYLVRPDGYVGLADEQADPATLRQYVETVRNIRSHS